MRLFTLLCFATIVVFSPTVSAEEELSQEDRQKIVTLFNEAQQLINKEDFSKANETLGEMLKLLPEAKGGAIDSNRSFVYSLMAKNSVQLNEKETAFNQLSTAVQHGFWDERALRSDPGFSKVRSDPGFQKILDEVRQAIGKMVVGLKDVHGNAIEKPKVEGKVVVMNVFGTWCPPCMMEIPHFVKLQKEYEGKGVQVIGLAWERRAPDNYLRQHVQNFVNRKELNYPVTMMPEANLYAVNVQSFPTTLFIGRDGTVRERFRGYRDYRALERVVKPLVRESVPAKAAEPAATEAAPNAEAAAGN